MNFNLKFLSDIKKLVTVKLSKILNFLLKKKTNLTMFKAVCTQLKFNKLS